MRYYTDEQLEIYKSKTKVFKQKEVETIIKKADITCDLFLTLDYLDLIQLRQIGEKIRVPSPIDDCIRIAIKNFIQENSYD